MEEATDFNVAAASSLFIVSFSLFIVSILYNLYLKAYDTINFPYWKVTRKTDRITSVTPFYPIGTYNENSLCCLIRGKRRIT